tara:strand:+ start:67 stop:384 length:318 start_codon:yes stop_codon:yes gene_type:complete
VFFKEDIQQRIKHDFNDSADKAIDILGNAILKTDYLKTDRIIRCIVFLANGDLNKLKKFIDNAIIDTRDVMLWAEYEEQEGDFNFKRIRNFNNTFDNAELLHGSE